MVFICLVSYFAEIVLRSSKNLEKSHFTASPWAAKMSRPCSQLDSEVIRGKAECHIIAAIEKTCSVVSFKCVWRVNNGEFQPAWNWICEKRDECDLTLSKLSKICFFSAITTSKVSRKTKETNRKRRLQRRICDQPFADFIARKTNFIIDFLLGGLSNSQWFRGESIQDSTCP